MQDQQECGYCFERIAVLGAFVHSGADTPYVCARTCYDCALQMSDAKMNCIRCQLPYDRVLPFNVAAPSDATSPRAELERFWAEQDAGVVYAQCQ